MVTARIADIPIDATVRWILWLVASMIGALLIVVMFPQLALWLPQALGYRV
jgi:TRAP-type C4-dicarboxylate transport system permease large subunit